MSALNATCERERLEREQLQQLEITSIVEASTLILLLLVAVPLKHLAGWSAAVTVIGPVHGLAFLAYVWTAVETAAGGRWSRREITRIFIVAFIPFGGFANLAFLRRKVARLSSAKAAGA
jgi:integral membrane protein